MNKITLRVDFITLLEQYEIKPVEALDYYLMETWNDLASQSVDQAKGVNRLAFLEYYELPSIINWNLFKQFDIDRNDYLSKEEFVNGFKKLFDHQNFSSLTDIAFKLYSNNGEYILKEDVRMMLAYIQQPKELLKKKTEGFRNKAIDPEIRAVYHEKLDIILNETFEKQSLQLTKEQFIEAIHYKCSDIFTLLIIFLYDHRPFNKDFLKLYQDKITAKANGRSISPAKPPPTIEIVLPLYKNSTAMTAMLVPKLRVNFGNDTLKKISSSNRQKEDVSYYFKPKIYSKKSTTKMSVKKSSSLNNNTSFREQSANQLLDGGYMFKITKNKKMKILWYRIICRDLFYYQSRSSLMHKGMHHLSNVFLNRKGIVEYKEAKLYSFCLIFNKRTRAYYVEKEEEYEQWVNLIERTIDQRDIENDYDITTNEDTIINGKYGLIKPAIQLVTNRDVIIKHIGKQNLTKQDKELVHYEMEILKFSQQRNIVRLYDIYEDNNYIYYVLEKCNGVDLFSYIEKRNYRLTEKRTCEIIHKILMSLYYLQSYGVIHRDLKPENVLMTDSSEEADIRLIGFNLSKIITKKEFCREPFGTLSYVSPEILTEKPYYNAVDIWSTGIITYLLLCGSLPFDDDHSEREIARQTIHDLVPFKNTLWNQYSNESKLFITDTLKKDPFKRIKVENALVHPWIKRYYPRDVERRLVCESKDMFRYYTMSVEEEDI